MFKIIIAKIFRMNDITGMITAIRTQEKRRNQKEIEKALSNQKLSLQRHHSLEIQGKDSEIELLEKRILQLEKYLKETEELQYKNKQQIKENFRVATELSMIVKNFTISINGFYGEITGLTETADNHRRKIEKIK